MTTGRNHARITKLLAIPAGLVGMTMTQSPVIGICVTIGVLSGLNIEPDLDISTLTHSERKLIYRHGLMGRLWSAYWYFYGLSFKHRSKWTHRPILGTALRLVYLFWLPLIVGFVVDPDITTGFLLSEYFIAYFVGLVIADTGHWLADGMP
ncbi:MAG: DUF2227 family putative metal-binding protein [Planctomycetaceae bacterium]|nr:DUF2227 family putative metal-binding protein [Planctomycetaceae bacterium]